LRSILEDIPSIGPKRRAALFKHFGSIEAIRKATLDELCQVEGMNRKAAESIQQYFGINLDR
jgi:excinuclease ABC subunit C